MLTSAFGADWQSALLSLSSENGGEDKLSVGMSLMKAVSVCTCGEAKVFEELVHTLWTR